MRDPARFTMLVGYVSDEQHVALADVIVELECDGQSFEARSRATGAIHADVEPGVYRVTLSQPGYGAKTVEATIDAARPCQFRLLSDRLLGYVWPKWSRAGEQAEFRVHSPEPYKLELWRYGFEKELVRRLGWFDEHGPRANLQILPDGDFSQTGAQWNKHGFGSKYHSQFVTAPAKSGLYYFHATGESGEFFSFPWIVSPASPRARIAVLTSNITWNAYNNFGGRSNYVDQDGVPTRPIVNARLDQRRFQNWGVWPYEVTSAPLSFERPEPFNVVPESATITDSIPGRLASAMAPAEWRLLGWLEREEFDYDLYSETDLHWGKLPLDAHRVLVLNTHPEYWSREMYARVKRWVYEEGGRLVYLGGCGLHAEVEFLDEHTMVCRQEGRQELRGDSAAVLLGVDYTHAGFQSAAPYKVIDATHWALEGTGLKAGDLFGSESLHERCPGGASGHELDKLSPDSPPGTRHLAQGTNGEGGGADMVMFETHTGGRVFSVGSLCWPLSLLIDDAASRITANVLRRFSG